MRPFLIALSLLAASVLTSACNTMGGFGEDMQSGGRQLERSAENNQDETTDTGEYRY